MQVRNKAGASRPPVQASTISAAGARRSRLRAVTAAAGLLAAVLLLLTLACSQQLVIAISGISSAAVGSISAAGAAAGQLPLVPKRIQLSQHELLYQLPANSPPKGLVLVLHKCGRSASDHWPRSAACPDCLGELPSAAPRASCATARSFALLPGPRPAHTGTERKAPLIRPVVALLLTLRRRTRRRHGTSRTTLTLSSRIRILPSAVLPGLPESVSKLKQALVRGYAVAAMSSADRSTGGGGRCWKARDPGVGDASRPPAVIGWFLKAPKHKALGGGPDAWVH